MSKIESQNLEEFWQTAKQDLNQQIQQITANPENVENGLVKLVLAIIELLREIMEKQAIRKIENGNLSEEQIEKLGLTLMRLEEKMEDFKKYFQLTDDDLKINLGNWTKLD